MPTYTALLTFSSDSADDAQSTIRQLRDGIESSDAYPVILDGWTFTDPATEDDLGPYQPAHVVVRRLYDQAGDVDSATLDRILVEAGYFAVCPICRWQDFAEGFQCGDCGLSDDDLDRARAALTRLGVAVDTLTSPADIIAAAEAVAGDEWDDRAGYAGFARWLTTSEALGAPGLADSGLAALEELAHDIASQEASDAINSGTAGVVAFLVAKGVTPADIYEAVRSPRERV